MSCSDAANLCHLALRAHLALELPPAPAADAQGAQRGGMPSPVAIAAASGTRAGSSSAAPPKAAAACKKRSEREAHVGAAGSQEMS